MGGFAESDIDKGKWSLASKSKDNGGAGTGFNVGLKLKFDIHSVSGLGVVVGADFFYNGMNSDVKDASDDDENGDITLPKYLNIPVMVGLNYEHAISSSCKLYGEVALGLNFRIITDITVEGFAQSNYDGSMYPYELTIDYDRATSFGFQLGAGIVVNDRYSLGLHYYILGSSKIKAESVFESEYSTDSEKYPTGKITPSILSLQLGYHF